MALSNILNEPRREITESLLGMGAVAGGLTLDYLTVRWLNVHIFPDRPCPWPLGMVLLPMTIVGTFLLGMLLLYVTHVLGEAICEALARRGLDPRPKRE